jgi:cytoskeletal protein CcmA (bactofilin family)
VIVLLVASAAHAATTRGGDRVVVDAGEVVADDLVVAASELVIDGRIEGDLVAAAETITINGVVTGDVLAAANRIVIAGSVGDDARLAAGVLELRAEAGVGDDLFGAAGTLTTAAASRVGGALAAAGSDVTLRGAVAQRADVAGQQLIFGGSVGDALVAYGDAVQVEASARVTGALTAYSPAPPAVAPGAQLGVVTHIRTERSDADAGTAAPVDGVAALLFDFLRQLATLLLVGAMLVWLLPTPLARIADGTLQQPGRSLLAGALTVAALVLGGSVLLLATIVGGVVFGTLTLDGLAGMVVASGSIALAGMIIATIFTGGVVAPVIVGYGVGRSLLAWLRPVWLERRLVPLALGVLLVAVLLSVPWVGALTLVLTLLLGLGAIWRERRGEWPAA